MFVSKPQYRKGLTTKLFLLFSPSDLLLLLSLLYHITDGGDAKQKRA